MESPRLTDGSSLSARVLASFSPAEPAIIKSSILRLFSNGLEGSENYWSGAFYYWDMFSCYFSVLLIPAAAMFVWLTLTGEGSRGKKTLKLLPAAGVIFAVTFNFVPSLFNVFSAISFRYVFIFLPFFAVMFSYVLDNIFKGRMSRAVCYVSTLVSCAVILYGGFSSYRKGVVSAVPYTIGALVFAVFGCIALDLICLSANSGEENTLKIGISDVSHIMLASVIALNLLLENGLSLYFQRSIVTKETEKAPMATENIIDKINKLEKDNFFRLESDHREGRMANYTWSYQFPVRTTAYYNSTIKTNVIDFYDRFFTYPKSFGWDFQHNYQECLNAREKSPIEDLLGVKYFITKENLDDKGWEIIDRADDLNVYINPDLDSIGLLFDRYISKSEADALSYSDRKSAIGSRLILDNADGSLQMFAEHGNDIEKEINTALDWQNTGAYAGTISALAPEGDMIGLELESYGDTSVIIPVNKNVTDDKNRVTQFTFRTVPTLHINYFCYLTPDDVWAGITAAAPVRADENEVEYSFTVPREAKEIGISVNNNYKVRMSFCTQTVNTSYTNKGVNFDNPGRGKTVSGTVEAENDSLLFLPVVYDEYWKAYVDGTATNIYEADYAFCAIKLPKGKHEVILRYENRLFRLGIYISIGTIASMAVFFAVFAFVKKLRNKPERT